MVILGSDAAALELLESLSAELARAAVDHELILVRNSASQSCEFLSPKGRLRRVSVLSNPHNPGFARSVNHGAREARGRHLLLLNPDVSLEGSSEIVEMLKTLEEMEGEAILAPRLKSPAGQESASGFGDFHFRPARFLAKYLPLLKSPKPSSKLIPVDWVAATVMLLSRSSWEAAGGFSEGYFMYFEDVDLCYRLSKLGVKTFLMGEYFAVHRGGASWGRSAQARCRRFFDYRQSRNLFLTRHAPLRAFLLHYLDLLAGARYNRAK